jgi:hypothetical protein
MPFGFGGFGGTPFGFGDGVGPSIVSFPADGATGVAPDVLVQLDVLDVSGVDITQTLISIAGMPAFDGDLLSPFLVGFTGPFSSVTPITSGFRIVFDRTASYSDGPVVVEGTVYDVEGNPTVFERNFDVSTVAASVTPFNFQPTTRQLRAPVAAAGTISSNGTEVQGVGTDFLSSILPGYEITSGGVTREVLSVESNTALTLVVAFPTDLEDAAYTIAPSGRFVFVLGHETAGHAYALRNGDKVVVSQVTDLTGIKFLKPTVRIRGAASMPDGLEWQFALQIDGADVARRSLLAGVDVTLLDVVANVSVLSGNHDVVFSLELVGV